ncbi:MAG TPA: response regulator [Chloroflexota bacterium]|nr:response regulator [Chloroflexota bacterium]
MKVDVEGSTESPQTGGDDQGQLVLVVEDDEVIRQVIGEILDERGFRVRTVGNGAEALAALDSEVPAAVVLDLLMPVMHGWAFMESYFEKTSGQAIPIVVVSVSPILPRSFDRFGVRRCIGKPFQVDDLVEAVEEATQPVAA